MSIEISSVTNGAARPVDRPTGLPQAQPEAKPEPEQQKIDIHAVVAELDQVSQLFNRRLAYSVNAKLNEVVVKVIDRQTDKVIKELPPKELQIVHERIREALGLLFDERI